MYVGVFVSHIYNLRQIGQGDLGDPGDCPSREETGSQVHEDGTV